MNMFRIEVRTNAIAWRESVYRCTDSEDFPRAVRCWDNVLSRPLPHVEVSTITYAFKNMKCEELTQVGTCPLQL